MESHLFTLEVFLYSIKQLHGKGIGSDEDRDLYRLSGYSPPFTGRGIAIQFLDYPVLYLAPNCKKQGNGSMENYKCGKRCMFAADPKEIQVLIQEVPLFVIYIDAGSNKDATVLASGSTMLGLHSIARDKPFSMDKSGFQTAKITLNRVSAAHTYEVCLSVRLGVLDHTPLYSHDQNLSSSLRMKEIIQDKNISKVILKEEKYLNTNKKSTVYETQGNREQCQGNETITARSLSKQSSTGHIRKLHHKPFTVPTISCHNGLYTKTMLKSRPLGASNDREHGKRSTILKGNNARGGTSQSRLKKNFRQKKLQTQNTKANKAAKVCQKSTQQSNVVCTKEASSQANIVDTIAQDPKIENCTHDFNADPAVFHSCKAILGQNQSNGSKSINEGMVRSEFCPSCSKPKSWRETIGRDSSDCNKEEGNQDHKTDVFTVHPIHKDNIVELVNLVSTRAILSQVVDVLSGTGNTPVITSPEQEELKGLLTTNSKEQPSFNILASLLSKQLCEAVIELGTKNRTASAEQQENKIDTESRNEQPNTNKADLDYQERGKTHEQESNSKLVHTAVQTTTSDSRSIHSQPPELHQNGEVVSQLLAFKEQPCFSEKGQEQESIVSPEECIDASFSAGSRTSKQEHNSGHYQHSNETELPSTASMGSQVNSCSEKANTTEYDLKECADSLKDLELGTKSDALPTLGREPDKCEEVHEIVVTMRTPSGALLGEIQSVGTSDMNLQSLEVFEDLRSQNSSTSNSSRVTESYDDDFEPDTDSDTMKDARDNISSKASRASSADTPRFVAKSSSQALLHESGEVICLFCARYGQVSSSRASSFVTADSSIDITEELPGSTVENVIEETQSVQSGRLPQ